MMENLFVNVFSSTVCDVILQKQKDKQVNEKHQLPCWKRKLVHNALLCIWSADEKQIRQTQHMELFIVTYQGGVVLAKEVLHGLQLSQPHLSTRLSEGIMVAYPARTPPSDTYI